MIDGIIAWSLRYRIVVLALAAVLLVWGGAVTLRVPVDVFPDLTAPTVTVVTEAHGMAPEEVESLITFPIETALNGAAGVRRVRSSTGVGISVVWVEFDWDTDIMVARQVVAEKLQLAAGSLPPDVDRPVLAPVSSIMGEIMFLALGSDRHAPLELRTTADWTLRRRLLAVPGVSQVVPIGGERKQYQVVARPDRLAAHSVGLDELVQALRESNENTSAGFYREGGQEWLIHGVGRVRDVADIAETLVTTRGGQPVLVRQLADVQIGAAVKRGEGSHDGNPAVILGVQKQPGANTLALTRQIDAVLDEIDAGLPPGMRIERHVFRQADFISVAVENVLAALRDGAILVVVIVWLFLASLRATVITVVAIPLSLIAAMLAVAAAGGTVNTMTLGGMAIAVGALVDDAIIDVENVVRRLRENARKPPAARHGVLTVIFEACREVRGSIVFATAIIVLVFLPLFALSGVEGRLLQPLGYAYVIALAASLAVALTVTPALCAVLLPESTTVARGEGRLVHWLKSHYEPVLRATLPRWRLVVALAVASVVLGGVGFATLGRAFLPDFNEGTLTISTVTLPGTSLAESDRLGRLVESVLMEQPEVTGTARRTGRAELDEHAQDVNASEIDVALRPGIEEKAAFLERLRRALTVVPGTTIVIGQPISHRIDHMLSGTRANLAVKIFGSDLRELRRIAAQVRDEMGRVPGVVDLAVEQQTDIPIVQVAFDRGAIARSGLRVRDVAEAIETAFAGQEVSRVRERDAAFDLMVRMGPDATADLDRIAGTLLTTATGAQVPLHALASITRVRGPSSISRENVQRKMVVMANVAGRDLVSVVEDVRRGIGERLVLPPGYHVEYGGQFESAESASRRLLGLGAVAMVGIFVLLVVALGSPRDAALVLVNLPLALVGGVAGVWLAGGVLSVASLIGFITLFGIATRNGLMMIAHVRHLIEVENVADLEEAVRRGALERLAPILMTALSAGLALIPLALAHGEPGSEIQAPMAMVILTGLLTSTALNMVVVPALYLRFGSLRTVAD